MNRLIIALAATTAFAGAAPAAAQYAGSNFQTRIGQLQTQLQAGVQSGGITRAEAMPLRQQLRQLTQLERRYASGGFSAGERSDLQNRMASLRQSIRMAARSGGERYGNDGRDGRWQDRDGRWHDGDGRYDDARPCPPGLAKKNNGCLPPGQVGRDDRDDNRYDRDDDRYDRDDRDYDRDGRRDDDGDYRQSDGRGVVGQIIDRVTGNGGLRVGQRASADLGGVPYAYRSRYSDGNGVYYRSDGRNIYQIDARTQTVARIYPMTR